MTLSELEQMDYWQLLDVCDTDPEHIAYGDEMWLSDPSAITDAVSVTYGQHDLEHADWQDWNNTRESDRPR